ncbi:MAG: SCO family protein [Magnetococcales bacterium]|nr:SCO family protein [Magnetococcales bacterium]
MPDPDPDPDRAGRWWPVLLLLGWFVPVVAWGGEYTTLDNDAALKTSQAVIGQPLDPLPLLDQDGRWVTLGDLRGKPLVISLIFTSCSTSCPVATRFLAEAVGKARDALGAGSFNVATIGFDPAFDNPAAMAAFARRQGIMLEHWSFLSGDAATLATLTRQLGFVFVRSPRGFDHITQATIVDAEGKIYRQVYGDVFELPVFVGALKDLVLGRPRPQEPFLASLLRQVRLFCTVYDPKRDVYRFDPSLFVGMFIGGTIIFGGFFLLIRELRRGRQAGGPS